MKFPNLGIRHTTIRLLVGPILLIATLFVVSQAARDREVSSPSSHETPHVTEQAGVVVDEIIPLSSKFALVSVKLKDSKTIVRALIDREEDLHSGDQITLSALEGIEGFVMKASSPAVSR